MATITPAAPPPASSGVAPTPVVVTGGGRALAPSSSAAAAAASLASRHVGTSSADDDRAYSSELARRAVARAALHLGVERMSADALAAVGDALVSFLDRFGESLSASVESSNRSSAHCSVLDALHAAEACTAPSALQVSLDDPEEDAATLAHNAVAGGSSNTATGARPSSTTNNTHGPDGSDPSWEGLATFLFGKKWTSIPVPGEGGGSSGGGARAENGSSAPASGPGAAASSTPNGGGGGKNAAIIARQQQQRAQQQAAAAAAAASRAPLVGAPLQQPPEPPKAPGWDAPYPDDVPPFPLRLNPHHPASLNFFKSLVSEEEACGSGDKVIVGSGHRCGATINGSAASVAAAAPSSKKPKSKAAKKKEEAAAAAEAARMAEAKAEEAAARAFEDGGRDVMTESYWGSVLEKTDDVASVEDKDSNDMMPVDSTPLKKSSTPKSDGGIKGGAKDDTTKKKKEDGEPGAKKRIRFDDDDGKDKPDKEEGQPNKKPKTDGGTSGLDSAEVSGAMASRPRRPAYVPPFLPPFPPARTYCIDADAEYSTAASDIGGAEAAAAAAEEHGHHHHPGDTSAAVGAPVAGADPTLHHDELYDEDFVPDDDFAGGRNVRKSLVRLGRAVGSSYWGAPSSSAASSASSAVLSGTVVPAGRRADLADTTAAQAPTGAAAVEAAAVVQPLGRASGTRVSKILEGSMDAHP